MLVLNALRLFNTPIIFWVQIPNIKMPDTDEMNTTNPKASDLYNVSSLESSDFAFATLIVAVVDVAIEFFRLLGGNGRKYFSAFT